MSKMNLVLRKVGLDKAVAAGTAALAAAGVLLIPADILSNAVVRAGLDTMFSPLQPPLGAKARIGLALLIAGTVFGIVVTAMSVLERLTAKRPVKARTSTPGGEESDDTPAPPRVRRRDRHPDAPTRAPFSPVRELGAPDGVIAEEEPPAGRIRRLRAAPMAEPEISSASQVATPWPERDPTDVAPEPVTHGAADPYLEKAPEPAVVAHIDAEHGFDPAPAPEPEPEVPPQPSFTERRGGERRGQAQTGRESIDELMERLERALGGDVQLRPESEAEVPVQDLTPEPAQAEEAAAPAGDHRLRSAIEHLRRVASRS